MTMDDGLPIDSSFGTSEDYIEALLHFVTRSHLHRTLCGGVHLLDFFAREPDVYATILPERWREFFATCDDMMEMLDLLMRDDLAEADQGAGREGSVPPEDLVQYIRDIRRLSLRRSFQPKATVPALSREVALGMKEKKIHEVSPFASYVDNLCQRIGAEEGAHGITHLIDLGSGQGYLTRALASAPYHHQLVGVESRKNNVIGSQSWDTLAGLTAKQLVMRNKKLWKEEYYEARAKGDAAPKADPSVRGQRGFFYHPGAPADGGTQASDVSVSSMGKGSVQYISHYLHSGDLNQVIDQIVSPDALKKAVTDAPTNPDGKPGPVPQATLNSLPKAQQAEIGALVIALHSCGNLLHHGLRSLLLTPSVKGVAMVGCCYNLLTERLGPPTHKMPALRSRHARVEEQERAADPHGFPMSQKLAKYRWDSQWAGPGKSNGLSPRDASRQDERETDRGHTEEGIRLNITARMMAVQAPINWGRADSAAFFQRHFFRAVLQRIFLDLGLIPPPPSTISDSVRPDENKTTTESKLPLVNGTSNLEAKALEETSAKPETTEEDDTVVSPVILGSLPKPAYTSFLSYVRAAAKKLARHETHPSFSASRGRQFAAALDGLSDEEVLAYEVRYNPRKKDLTVMWSLMAFSAQLVESLIVADRWLWLKEQDEVEHAWVEPVFDYSISPRNLVVVGIKKLGSP